MRELLLAVKNKIFDDYAIYSFWYMYILVILLPFFLDGIKAQMAHAKAVNRKKNNDDYEDSPHHDGTQPITGGDQGQGDDYDNAQLPPPKKKKNKIKPPTSLNSSGVGMYVFLKNSIH